MISIEVWTEIHKLLSDFEKEGVSIKRLIEIDKLLNALEVKYEVSSIDKKSFILGKKYLQELEAKYSKIKV